MRFSVFPSFSSLSVSCWFTAKMSSHTVAAAGGDRRRDTNASGKRRPPSMLRSDCGDSKYKRRYFGAMAEAT